MQDRLPESTPKGTLSWGYRVFALIGQKRIKARPLRFCTVQASAQILDLIDKLAALPITFNGHGVDPLSKHLNFNP